MNQRHASWEGRGGHSRLAQGSPRLQDSPLHATQHLRGMEAGQATILAFISFSYVWCTPTSLCARGPWSPARLGGRELCPLAFLCLLALELSFVHLVANPARTTSVTGLGAFACTCSGRPQPRLLNLSVVVHALVITLVACLLGEHLRHEGKGTTSRSRLAARNFLADRLQARG